MKPFSFTLCTFFSIASCLGLFSFSTQSSAEPIEVSYRIQLSGKQNFKKVSSSDEFEGDSHEIAVKNEEVQFPKEVDPEWKNKILQSFQRVDGKYEIDNQVFISLYDDYMEVETRLGLFTFPVQVREVKEDSFLMRLFGKRNKRVIDVFKKDSLHFMSPSLEGFLKKEVYFKNQFLGFNASSGYQLTVSDYECNVLSRGLDCTYQAKVIHSMVFDSN